MSLLIENGKVLQPNYSLREQSVAVEDTVITGVGGKEKMRKSHKRYDRIDATGCLVMPGFINAHTHMALGLAQGFGVGMPLFEMFENVLFPLEKKMTDNHAYLGALVAGLEFLHTGTTTINNINARWSKPVLKALDRLGLRGTMALALKDRDIKTSATFDCKSLPENEWLVKRLEDHPLLSGMFGLANEVEATESLIKTVRQLAVENHTGVHLHVAESLGEKGFVLQRTGKTSVRYLYDLGVLSDHSLAVHAVNVSKKDVLLLSKSRVTVVHCPTANLNLGTGIAPVADMLEAGVAVGLGVDHPVANMSNDLRRELSNALLLQQTLGKQLSLKQLLSMAFNSRLYGHATGTLAPGSLADLVVVSMRDRVVPQDDSSLLQKALFADSPVIHSIINGELVMRDQKILRLNEKNTLKKAQKFCKF
ncbi:MAG: amidohydrolase family protein [Candidatus Diapherotrites archaeon]|nr:amidohydrolase family protein [Candidatus Diapherotrites archaeon]